MRRSGRGVLGDSITWRKVSGNEIDLVAARRNQNGMGMELQQRFEIRRHILNRVLILQYKHVNLIDLPYLSRLQVHPGKSQGQFVWSLRQTLREKRREIQRVKSFAPFHRQQPVESAGGGARLPLRVLGGEEDTTGR